MTNKENYELAKKHDIAITSAFIACSVKLIFEITRQIYTDEQFERVCCRVLESWTTTVGIAPETVIWFIDSLIDNGSTLDQILDIPRREFNDMLRAYNIKMIMNNSEVTNYFPY